MSIKILRAADKGKSPLTTLYKMGSRCYKALQREAKAGIIVFLLISILLHLGALMIAPQTREAKKTLPRQIPVDVIELPQPHPLLPSPFPFAEEKKIAKPLPPANPPVSPFDKGDGEDEKTLPSKPIVKEEKPLSLYPTKERLAEMSEKYEKEAPVGEKDRNISFDTSEPRYTSYFEGLKAKIYHEWGYPDAAVRGGLAGRLFVRFVILKDGTLEDITLIRGSGYPMLDDAAISAIRLAAPFYPFQKSFGSLERITVNASFEYILEPYINRQRQ